MEIVIGILLITIIVLVVGFIKQNKTIKVLNVENKKLSTEITKAFKLTKDIQKELNTIETQNRELWDENIDLNKYLKLFISAKLKVFVHSNFHSNYNIYNGKFYAKIKGGKSNISRVEGIPVLTVPDNKYTVIDVYLLKRLLKEYPDRPILASLSDSKTLKEGMIRDLNNKVLTSYGR